MKRVRFAPIVLVVLSLLSCSSGKEQTRETMDLSGRWQFSLDNEGIGVAERWYLTDLPDSVSLPGTTDSNQKGFLNREPSTLHLNRVFRYEGAAWYRKRIMVPESFEHKHVELFLERTRSSTLWIDSMEAGSSHLLQSPQKFDLTGVLTPGEHHITLRIDNNLALTPFGNVHIYSDDTQTNWNGIIGKLFLEASSRTRISDLQVTPRLSERKIEIRLGIDNPMNLDTVDVTLRMTRSEGGKSKRLKPKKIRTACLSSLDLEYALGKEIRLWDEFEQPLYSLTAILSCVDGKDSRSVTFGLRQFSAEGTRFVVNGRPTFLRGKNDAAVFPLTGYTPMNVGEWTRVFQIAKSYGINHYRFHSYCPPEAAFVAADRAGIYLQAELPFWGGLDSDSVSEMLREEGMAMLKTYANHPSFVMFSHGNEIWSGHDRVEENILAFKAYDSRPLYTMGSNNNIGYVDPRPCSDFFVGARTPYPFDTILTHTRLTHAFADSRDGGILNTQTPNTESDFSYAVSHIPVPLVSHEIGQYQIYPDYREIEKYSGVLRARNLELFRERLIKSGMGQMDSAFRKASGAWSAACYRAEMEAALRTPGMAGFQLLDLQDFPGQGTALVGILDAFMDSKEVISPETWRQSCSEVVLLLTFPGYCLTSPETFRASASVANFSNAPLRGDPLWELQRENGEVIHRGEWKNAEIRAGEVQTLGTIEADLSSILGAQKCEVHIWWPGTPYRNSYPIWVYPPSSPVQIPEDITVADRIDSALLSQLHEGGKVLLFPRPEDMKGRCVAGLFPPDFWNYGMFRRISKANGKPVSPGTLGLLTDPDHPLFSGFPTEFHTHWQWFSIVRASHPMILDQTPDSYLPIVQVIDNLERNHKLGLIFEFRVDKGKLLVCMSRLPGILDRPEAAQLFRSILNYMDSDDFDPGEEIVPGELADLFSPEQNRIR